MVLDVEISGFKPFKVYLLLYKFRYKSDKKIINICWET